MKSGRTPAVVIVVVSLAVSVFAVLGGAAIYAQDTGQAKYTVRVPNGLAFSEFRGYEGWQTVSISHNEKVMAVILANPAIDQRLQVRDSRQWQAIPRRLPDGEDPLEPEKDGDIPQCDGAGKP